MLPLWFICLATTAFAQSTTTSQVESESPIYPVNSYVPSAQQRRPIYTARGPETYSYMPYAFNYVAQGEDGSSSRQETADGSGRVVGSYTLAVEDGRRRVVDYVADQDGFRATVDTNEPGTDIQNPADVVFHSAGVGRANEVAYRPTTSYRPRPAAIYSAPNVVRPVYHADTHANYYRHDGHAYDYNRHLGHTAHTGHAGHTGHAYGSYYNNDHRYYWH